MNLSGTTVIEGGTVIKFASGGTAAINVLGSITCQTRSYDPAIFTAKDDNSVGDAITGSNPSNLNNPAFVYANPALYLQNTGSDIAYIRIFHAQQGVHYNYYGTHALRHSQFRHCQSAILPYRSTLNARNLLLNNVVTAFDASYDSMFVNAEHLTVNGDRKSVV